MKRLFLVWLMAVLICLGWLGMTLAEVAGLPPTDATLFENIQALAQGWKSLGGVAIAILVTQILMGLLKIDAFSAWVDKMTGYHRLFIVAALGIISGSLVSLYAGGNLPEILLTAVGSLSQIAAHQFFPSQRNGSDGTPT